jgi:hypothetical protein
MRETEPERSIEPLLFGRSIYWRDKLSRAQRNLERSERREIEANARIIKLERKLSKECTKTSAMGKSTQSVADFSIIIELLRKIALKLETKE